MMSFKQLTQEVMLMTPVIQFELCRVPHICGFVSFSKSCGSLAPLFEAFIQQQLRFAFSTDIYRQYLALKHLLL